MGLLVKDVPPHMMGTQVALLLVCNQLVASLGPWAISLADDGSADIRRPILSVVATCCAASGVAFAFLGFLHHGEEKSQAAAPPINANRNDGTSANALPPPKAYDADADRLRNGGDLASTETAALLANKADPPNRVAL